jgi:hypothetical protein
MGFTITNSGIDAYDDGDAYDRIWNAFVVGLDNGENWPGATMGPGGYITRQHDSSENSVRITGRLVNLIRGKGFRLVSLTECLTGRRVDNGGGGSGGGQG